jgi:hypothetical protein
LKCFQNDFGEFLARFDNSALSLTLNFSFANRL